jgi:hypothetical protein
MPPRGGRGASVDQRAIQTRRAVAGGALLIVLILIVIGIHSCTVSAGNGALRSYNDSVFSLIRSSNQTGQQFFRLLSGGTGASTGSTASNITTLESRVNLTRIQADDELGRAKRLSAPGQLALAQQALVWVMRLRRDGIANTAGHLEAALQKSTAATAVNAIAVQMANLYASDALYKNYVLPMIVSALTRAGISVGGTNGEPVDNVQFLPDIGWTTPSFVAQKLNTTVPTSSSKAPPPGTAVGHALDSCSVGGTALSTTAATSLPAGTTPTLTCTVTNDGAIAETNVVVRATIGGTSVVGQGIISQTQPNQQSNVQIQLSGAPPNGTYSMTVTVEHVPGEKTFLHNTKVFPVTFG